MKLKKSINRWKLEHRCTVAIVYTVFEIFSIARHLFLLNDLEQLVHTLGLSQDLPEQQATTYHIAWGDFQLCCHPTGFVPNHKASPTHCKIRSTFYFMLVLSRGLHTGIGPWMCFGLGGEQLFSYIGGSLLLLLFSLVGLLFKPWEALLRAVQETLNRGLFSHALLLLSSPCPQQKTWPEKPQSPGSLAWPFSGLHFS